MLGSGFVVYAFPGVGSLDSASGGSGATSTSPQRENVFYRLVPVAPAATGANGSGYAGITIDDQSLSIDWLVAGAMPGEQLEMVMGAVATSTTGANKSFAFATVQVSPQGEAKSTGSATLAPGNYSIGLAIIDTTNNSTMFTSDPSVAQVVIGPSLTTQGSQGTIAPPSAVNGLSYSLVPLPVYLGQSVPTNYSFREGGALIIASGNQLQVTTSFLAAPHTRFVDVVQTGSGNFTLGAVTTTSRGGGVFKGNVTLAPGTYDVGLLLYVYGDTTSPVAVSMPRAIQVTLPVTRGISSTTTTGASSSGSSTTNETTTSGPSPPSPGAVGQLQFAPVTTAGAPGGYLYGKGYGGFALIGGSIYFSLLFSGQNPHTNYSLLLSVNGTSRAIGNYTTSGDGGASVKADATLG
ncbi:MAG: hypothetical protein ACRD6W_01310, partial [Nitrososphaerales archaeon]